jgi:hypothetical protein
MLEPPEEEYMAAFSWGQCDPEVHQGMRLSIGDLQLWVQRVDDEWHLGAHYTADSTEGGLDTAKLEIIKEPWPKEVCVSRWVTAATGEKLHMLPVVPDLPVVVRPEQPIHLAPGRRLEFFLTVPAWIRVSAGGKKPLDLAEFPTEILSKTWFGDPTEGELSYSLTTLARPKLETLPVQSHMLTCPVVARNTSKDSLVFERICVRMPHLRTYQGVSRLWTNQLRVNFKGHRTGSTVDYDIDPPGQEEILGLLGHERQKQARGQSLRSFTFLSTFGDLLGNDGGL